MNSFWPCIRETGPSDIMSNAISERRQTSEAALPEMTRQDIYLAVHRYDNSVYYRRIGREAFPIAVLSAVR